MDKSKTLGTVRMTNADYKAQIERDFKELDRILEESNQRHQRIEQLQAETKLMLDEIDSMRGA